MNILDLGDVEHIFLDGIQRSSKRWEPILLAKVGHLAHFDGISRVSLYYKGSKI